MSGNPIVVVGASLAGLRAACALRDRGFDGRLLVVGEEHHAPYDRPPLSKEILAGTMDEADAALRVPDDLDAEWLLGERATRLDPARRVLTTERTGEIPYLGIVIATGVRPKVLPGLQLDGERVFTLRTLDDARRLRTALRQTPRLLIVGAGFIGVEVATTARALGCPVTIVSADPPVAAAGAYVSAACDRLLAELGVRLIVGVPVTEWGMDTAGLADGSRVGFDAVLVAIGSTPNVEWLAGSGLVLDDGVHCDASLAAIGAAHVVAAGDIARWPNPVFDGVPMRVEHWSNAVEQGSAAARTLLDGPGSTTACAAVPSFWSDHGGARLQSVGVPGFADRIELVDGSVDEARFALAAYRGPELVGALTYGIPRALARYRVALARRTGSDSGAATPVG